MDVSGMKRVAGLQGSRREHPTITAGWAAVISVAALST
jgi:hypothetical protein